MNRLKIIYVTANLPHGADEAFIIPEVDQLKRLGHEVLLIPRSPRGRIVHGQDLLKQARRETLFSAQVMRTSAALAMAAPGWMSAVWRVIGGRSAAVAVKNIAIVPKALWLADAATRWGAGHIHCHWAGTTASMAMLASRVSGVPWSLTLHRWDIVENNLLAEKVRSASFARFISQDGLRMAKAIGIGPATNARVLHMGVNIPHETPRKAALRKPLVLCPARLVAVKGHRFLLEAWKRLQDRGMQGELWLAGQGELRPALQAMTDTLGLNGSVRFLGALPHRELLKMYEEGTVSAVVLASIDMGNGNHEGIPVALIEAMSYGIPVVATRTGGTAELVSPGTGLLAPPEDPAALADAIHSLLDNAIFARQIGEAGRRRVAETHDIVRIASELSDAFEAASRTAVAATPQYA